MNKKPFIVAGVALVAWFGVRWTISGNLGAIAGDIEQGASELKKAITGWNESFVPVEYRALIRSAEAANNIPQGMLARLLYQESHYRADIISGATRSPVGALGIAQFMPATANEWDINPLDPNSAIPGAARYLAWLYRQTGAWDKALAAYNWGVGNVTRKGLAVAPAETRTYYTSILKDIGLA